MLIISLFLAEQQEVSPRTFVIGGTIALIIGLWLSLAVINRRVRALERWEDGPMMSRLGVATGATIAYLVATMFFAHVLGWNHVELIAFFLIFPAISCSVLIGLRDYARSRKRI